MFQNIVVNENAVEANYSAGLWVLVIGFILFLFFSMRGVDVTAQLAEEDYGRPSWGFAGYVSWSSLGKFVAVTIIALVFFLFSIWMLSLIFSMYIDEWTVITRSIFSLVVFFEFLVCIWFYPALVLTLVRTESFFKMLKFSENYKTITHYVGKKNYMIMASLMSNVTLMFLFYSLVIDVLGINLLTLGIAFFLCFFALHFFVAIHYLVGLLSGYSELQEEEEEANEYELDFDDMLDDVKICVNNGYPEDAITLLTNVIQNKTEPPKAQLTMYKVLIDLYKKVRNENMVLRTRQEMVNYATREAPYLQKKVLPIMVDLFMASEFTPEPDEILPMVKAAYATNRKDAIFKLVQGFEKNNPIHADIVDNYFVLALVMIDQGKYESAYKTLGYLIKKYPKSRHIVDVRSQFLAVKRKLDPEKIMKNKLASS